MACRPEFFTSPADCISSCEFTVPMNPSESCADAAEAFHTCTSTITECEELGRLDRLETGAPCLGEIWAMDGECFGPPFACGDGSEVLSSRICDGFDDCPDASDEADC